MNIAQAMNLLRGLGAVTVEVSFSGGNDEGGADGMDVFDANKQSIKVPNSSAYRREVWDHTTKRWVSQGWTVSENVNGQYAERPASSVEQQWAELRTVLEEPIYDRWGSFAGEFQVYGTLTWDVATGQHKITGQESVYQDFEL